MVDLTKTDIYDNHTAPDPDVEIALKVIRTARDACLMPGQFDAEGAVLLSHAHAWLHRAVEQIQGGSDLPLDIAADHAHFDSAGQDSDLTDPGLSPSEDDGWITVYPTIANSPHF